MYYDDEILLGTEFVLSHGRLSRSVPVSKNDFKSKGKGKSNEDNIYIFCKACQVYLDFVDRGNMNGYWSCPKCGKKVRELTAYKKLDKENAEFMDIWFDN